MNFRSGPGELQGGSRLHRPRSLGVQRGGSVGGMETPGVTHPGGPTSRPLDSTTGASPSPDVVRGLVGPRLPAATLRATRNPSPLVR